MGLESRFWDVLYNSLILDPFLVCNAWLYYELVRGRNLDDMVWGYVVSGDVSLWWLSGEDCQICPG